MKTISAAVIGHSNVTVDIEVPDSVIEAKPDHVRQPHELMIRIVNQRDGDMRLAFDTRKTEDAGGVATAFSQLLERGFKPYRVDAPAKKGKEPEVSDRIDLSAGEVIMTPMRQVVGG